MKRNKSILHLCEVILGVLMLILILNLYLVKLLVDPDISYTPMYRNLCLTLALLVFCMVLALIQRELLARLLHNAYRDVTGIHNKKIPGEKASGIKRSRHHIRCRCYDV